MKNRKTLRLISSIAAILLFITAFSACGKNAGATSGVYIDLGAFAREITAGSVFSDELTPVDRDNILMRYAISGDDVAEYTAGMSSQVTANEYAVFIATNAAAAKRIKTAVDDLIALQKASYGSYGPQEVPKLDNAVVKVSGLCVLYVCADDYAAAGKVIAKYIK